ncbi:MAG: T9SS type A sorting domain-containing protein [Sporocytophaga sp.]|uniref:plastocyanin/azurin family copper-binding protein n=1 Tax=Sporocytophaga sp. TaxID=2231183 RepID=UPI001B0A3DF4|nr:plastocyanin/azurin family copper-binding protein [Sporocytophaga sp.]MBO9702971.1 T9SS type A sorting domain-containing protein [Sporocytophaga sp.]
MKKIFIATLFSLIISSSNAAIHVVLVGQGGNKFAPTDLNVIVGDTVRFQWVSGFHTTTSTSIPAAAESWDEVIANSGDEFDYIVKTEGKYSYVCTPHAAMGMVGSFTATQSVTGIASQYASIKESANITPNPATDHTTLIFNSDIAFKGFLKIYDNSGIMISEEKLKVEKGENSILVSTSLLKSGLYYVNLFNQEDVFLVKKMIKQ